MTTFKKTHKRKVSNLVKRQLPDFVLEDHPKFAEFVKSYFLFLESAQLEISSFTAVDNILLEGEGTADNFVLLERTDSFGLDAGDKVVNEEGLRSDKEFVMHKILDCMGDLMLANYKIFGKIKCSKGGHQLTNEFLRELMSNKENFSIVEFKEKILKELK